MDDSDEEIKPKIPTWKDKIQLGASEVMFLIGLALLMAGVWIWFGIGQSLSVGGVALLILAMLNGIVRDALPGRNDVI